MTRNAVPADYLKSNNFDLIRLFASAQVALQHCMRFLNPDVVPYLTWLDYLPGVPIFFFISGFLVSTSWERNPHLGTYVVNRALRIYPALWAVFFLSLACLLIFYPFTLRHVPPLSVALWGLAQMTAGQDWNPGFLRDFGIGVLNGQLWTIPIELGFYVGIPILYWLFRKTGAATALLGVVILSSLGLEWMDFYFFMHPPTPLAIKALSVSPLPWMGMFAVGILAQRKKNILYPLVAGRFTTFLALYVGIAFLSRLIPFPPLLQGRGNWLGVVNFAMLSLLVLAAAFSYRTVSDAILRRNDVSYGVYIFHMPVVNLLIQEQVMGAVGSVLAVLATLGLALLSWFLVEKPALRLRRASIHQRR